MSLAKFQISSNEFTVWPTMSVCLLFSSASQFSFLIFLFLFLFAVPYIFFTQSFNSNCRHISFLLFIIAGNWRSFVCFHFHFHFDFNFSLGFGFGFLRLLKSKTARILRWKHFLLKHLWMLLLGTYFSQWQLKQQLYEYTVNGDVLYRIVS